MLRIIMTNIYNFCQIVIKHQYYNISVLVNEHEEGKQKLAYVLRDPNIDVEKAMIILKKQQKANRKVIKFLRIELGAEAVFQIAGKILT